jgi:hypothetical protein
MRYTDESRGTKATRALMAFSAGGPKPRPLAFVEAVLIAPEHEREALIQRAATELAECPDAPAAAVEIADAFLDELPRVDVVPDGLAMAKTSPISGAGEPAPYLAPGTPSVPAAAPAAPAVDRNLRSIADIRTVAQILGLAVRRNMRLREVCAGIVEKLQKLAGRVRSRDASGAAALQVVAVTLRKTSSRSRSLPVVVRAKPPPSPRHPTPTTRCARVAAALA